MNEHRSVRRLLALRPADWSGEEQRKVEAHLAACSDCAQLARTYAAQDRLLRSTPRVGLTPAQRGQLLPRIIRERRRYEMRTKLVAILGAVTSVAALVALGFGVKALLPQSVQPSLETPFAMSPASLQPLMYTVQEGDTLVAIAQAYSVSVEALIAANSLTDASTLHVGQVLVIPNSPFTPTPTPAPATVLTESNQIRHIPAPDGRWTATVNEATGSLDLQNARGEILSVFPEGSTVDTVEWSPDSHYLLAVRINWLPAQPGEGIQASGPAEIWQVRVGDDRVEPPFLLFRPDPQPGEQGLDIAGPSEIAFGQWSPTGRYVLFWLGPSSPSIQADGVPLRVLDVETGQITLLTDAALLNSRYQSWAPDGSALVFTAGGYRSAQVNKWLNLFDVVSAQVTTVVSKTEQIPGIVAWSPQGDMIAYAAVPSSETDDSLADWMVLENPAIAGRRIYLLDPATGHNWRLNDADTFQDAPTWSEDGAILYYVEQEGNTVALMAADPATGQAQVVEGSRQPAPDMVGYYGQSDWDDWLAYRNSPSTIPFTICQSSETWTRPGEAEQAAQVWDAPRRQGISREMLWWIFQQSFYYYGGGNSEMFDAWPELGLWTAVSDADLSGLCDAENWSVITGQEIELWVLLHRVIAAQRQGDEYTIIVEPVPAGYQIVHLPGPGPDTPITVRFVDTVGREIDHLPKLAPWAAVPTTGEVVTVTGTVVDNALSAQVVTLEDADGVMWYVPWLDGTIVRWADGRPALFQDIAPGVALDVTGFRRADATTPNTLAAVRVIIPQPPTVEEARTISIPEMWPTSGDPVEGTLEAGGVDEWQFDGKIARSITIQTWLHPGAGSNPDAAITFTLYDPDGNELARASGNTFQPPFIYLPGLPGEGTYRLRVESDSVSVGRYSFVAVWFAASPSDTSEPPRASMTDPAQGAAHPSFQWPTARREVSGYTFRDPRDPGHLGLDIAADEGEPVVAVAGGTVLFAGWSGGHGNLVIVTHANGWSSYYAHLSEIAVATGQQVRQGDVLGKAGSTGFSTGPHLCFELRYQERPVDPRIYLPYGEATTMQVGGLTVEEYPLVSADADTPDHMEFGQYALPGMKSRRAAWRTPIVRCAAGILGSTCPSLTINGHKFTLELGDTNSSGTLTPLIVHQDGIPIYTHTIPTDYFAGTYYPILLEWQGQWVLEVVKDGQVIVNGVNLNEQLGYEKIFNWTILHGQPFYFFAQGGRIHVSYGGRTLPDISYDEVVHDMCCEPAIFNVTTCADMVAFYARRGDTWYYVEMGVYD